MAPQPVMVLPVRDPFSIPPGFPITAGGSSTGSGTDTGTGTSTDTGTGTSTGTGTGTGSTTTPTSSTPGGTTGPGTGTGGTGNGNGNGPAGTSATTTVGGHQVTLLDTSSNGAEQATVEVDSTVYHPSAGDSFGPNRQYMLQSVNGNCATFLFGDEAFTLCVPQNK